MVLGEAVTSFKYFSCEVFRRLILRVPLMSRTHCRQFQFDLQPPRYHARNLGNIIIIVNIIAAAKRIAQDPGIIP